jgi:hypothetical protein
MLEKSEKYVETARIELLMNYDHFVSEKYGEEKLIKRSKIV